MKKTALLLSVGVLLFWSCEKESTKPEVHELVGTWDAQTETHYWGSISNPDSTEVTTYSAAIATQTWTFEADDNYKVSITIFGVDFLTLEGTWSTSGDQLTTTVTFSGIEIQQVYTYDVDGDELTVTQELDPDDDEGDWAVIVFSKQ